MQLLQETDGHWLNVIHNLAETVVHTIFAYLPSASEDSKVSKEFLIDCFLLGTLQHSDPNAVEQFKVYQRIFEALVVVYKGNDNKLYLNPNEKTDKHLGYRHAFYHEYQYEKDGTKLLPKYTITPPDSNDMIDHLLQTKEECFKEETMKFLSMDDKIAERMEKVFLHCFDIKHDNLKVMIEEQLKEYQRNNEKLDEKLSKIGENVSKIGENVDAILGCLTQKHKFANIVQEVIRGKIQPALELDAEQEREVKNTLNLTHQSLRESSNCLELVNKTPEPKFIQASSGTIGNENRPLPINSSAIGLSSPSHSLNSQNIMSTTSVKSIDNQNRPLSMNRSASGLPSPSHSLNSQNIMSTTSAKSIGNRNRTLSMNSSASGSSIPPSSQSRGNVHINIGQTNTSRKRCHEYFYHPIAITLILLKLIALFSILAVYLEKREKEILCTEKHLLDITKRDDTASLKRLKDCFKEFKLHINDKMDKTGQTPLMVFAEANNLEAVEFLLKNGANIHTKDDRAGNIALHLAAIKGNLKIVVYLAQKANMFVNFQNDKYETACQLAKKHNRSNVVSWITNKTLSC